MRRRLLLLGRTVQGAGGALTIPTTTALLIAAFNPGERAKAIGVNTGISSVFLILGPAVGGFLTQYISWRSIFYINIPLVIFGIIMAFAILNPGKRKQETFHFSGAILMVIGIVLLIVGIMQGNEWGWDSPLTLSLIAIGPLFIAAFIWVSSRTLHPIIDFRLFHNRLFTAANLSLFLTQIIVMTTVLWAIYFQAAQILSRSNGVVDFCGSVSCFYDGSFGWLCCRSDWAEITFASGICDLKFCSILALMDSGIK